MKKGKGLVITTNDSTKVVEFEIGKSYNILRDAVDGYIECVHLPSFGVDLWLNEEGKLIGLPVNFAGSLLWAREYGQTDIIVGDIIITGGADEEGETLGLSDEQIKQITDFVGF